ncbi:pilus assembly protein TadG-related protein [Pseudomonas fragi]|uniref:pilus assembly protein TadG-related protein n=1 Tax=Pseudomonas fragi TaxID=296 RepID=UPI0002F034BB|nr:pilus assembly protein TadG-related protein [Pseudomonas fragi]MDE4516491.1 hypothetical protein [Pseudomonas fragi]QPC36381.1 hypothetical protein IS178_03950 [Pseudomonas fragi]SDU42194.1 Uncharacterized membrane protein [Pseudomonas fragi]
MSPQLRGMGFNGSRQQRGAIGLMAAVTLGMVLLFMLLVVDSGRLYLEQRKLQRVADMAVLEAVSRGGNCTGTSTAAGFANQSATRNSFTPGSVQKVNTTCGTLSTNSSQLRVFTADATKSDAIRVIATTTVPTSVAGGLWSLFSKGGFNLNTNLTASAVGSNGGAPLAQLTIRSALLTIDSTQSPILDQLVGGLLGGSIKAGIVSWQGLVDTNINLLSYLNQLISLNANAGNLDQLLKTNIHVTQLLDAAITVLQKNGPTADVAVKGLTAIRAVVSSTQVLKLGDLINVQSGTPNAGLDTNLRVFDLLQGIVQLAGQQSAATVNVQINPFNLVNINVYTKIIQPPQLSAIGNPALIRNNPTGPNQISVRTAQVQTRIQIGLPVLNALKPLTDLITNALSTVTEIVGKLLNLKLVDAISCLFSCDSVASISLVNDINVYIEAASANSYVTDYRCTSDTSKSLTAQANTALAKISIGASPSTGMLPTVDVATNSFIISPVKLININLKTCALLGLGGCSTGVGDGGSFNLLVQTNLSPTTQSLDYASPTLLNINQAPYYKKFGSNANVLTIGSASGSIVTTSYTPPTGKSVTGSLLQAVAGLITTLTTDIVSALNKVLVSLVNPIINTLLSALGVNVAVAEVGANLSCNQGGRAQLVL